MTLNNLSQTNLKSKTLKLNINYSNRVNELSFRFNIICNELMIFHLFLATKILSPTANKKVKSSGWCFVLKYTRQIEEMIIVRVC